MTNYTIIKDKVNLPTKREMEIRRELDECYKAQSTLGRGLGLYDKIRELDAELMRIVRERNAK